MCGGYSLKKINVDIDAYYSTLNRVEINLKIKNLSGESVYVDSLLVELSTETELVKTHEMRVSRKLSPKGEEESEIYIPVLIDLPYEEIEKIATRGKITLYYGEGDRIILKYDIKPPSRVEVLEIEIGEPEEVVAERFRSYPTYVLMHPRRPLITDEILLIPAKEIDELTNRIREELLISASKYTIGIAGLKVNRETVKGIGGRIFGILDKSLRLSSLLNELRPEYLIFETSKPGWEIPLELMHDGEEFLAIKYSIGRILRMKSAPRTISPEKFVIRRGKIKTIGAVFSYVGFREYINEINEMVDFFESLRDKGIEVHCMKINQMGENRYSAKITGNYPSPLDPEEVPSNVINFLMSRKFDLVYISSHGHIAGDIGEPHLYLTTTKHQLTASKIAKELSFDGQTTVILNACYGGSDLVASFLIAGARAVIAPIFPSDLNLTYRFTRKLLSDDFLRSKKPLGKILRETKRKMKDEAKIDWLTFVLYGDPRLYP